MLTQRDPCFSWPASNIPSRISCVPDSQRPDPILLTFTTPHREFKALLGTHTKQITACLGAPPEKYPGCCWPGTDQRNMHITLCLTISNLQWHCSIKVFTSWSRQWSVVWTSRTMPIGEGEGGGIEASWYSCLPTTPWESTMEPNRDSFLHFLSLGETDGGFLSLP